MTPPRSAERRSPALRGPVFRFKAEHEAFLRETFEAMARLPD